MSARWYYKIYDEDIDNTGGDIPSIIEVYDDAFPLEVLEDGRHIPLSEAMSDIYEIHQGELITDHVIHKVKTLFSVFDYYGPVPRWEIERFFEHHKGKRVTVAEL